MISRFPAPWRIVERHHDDGRGVRQVAIDFARLPELLKRD